MDVKDLMIGDWVFDGDEVARVTSLTCDGVIETTCRISNIEVVTPIPLTPEILEKNGFEIIGKRKYFLVPNDSSLAIKREPIIGANGESFIIGHFGKGIRNSAGLLK